MKKTVFTKMVMLAGLITLSLTSFSQIKTLHDSANTFIMERVFENNDKGILWWKCDSMKYGELFTTYKIHTGLGTDDSMVAISTWDEGLSCLRHTAMRQHHKNIPVEGAEVIEHYNDDGTIVFTNGQIVDNFSLGNIPAISESTALDSALEAVNSTFYFWELPLDTINKYNYSEEDSTFNPSLYYPVGSLVYALTGDRSIEENNYKLAYKFNIQSIEPFGNQNVYIDALTGEFIKAVTLMCSGDFTHIYYGNQYLDTKWRGGIGYSKYYLEGDDNGKDIVSQDNWNKTKTWAPRNLPEDKDDHWYSDHWGATAAHYVVSEAWDYFDIELEHKSFDNNNKKIYVHAYDPDHLDPSPSDPSGKNVGANFFYDEIYDNAHIYFADFNDQYTGALDVGGHEFTHGIDHYSRGLEYEFESGALDESFADIFGYMSERRTYLSYGWTPNWTLGEYLEPGGLRNMQDPSLKGDPNWYSTHPNWLSNPAITDDFGGVHTNSGVQNRWFYLLSMGGIQNSTIVNGIGQEKAAKIAFYTLRNLVMPNETYLQVREHSIAAAIILYGFCSPEHIETCKAWKACNIGNSCDCIGDISEVYCPDCITNSARINNDESNNDYLDEDIEKNHLDSISIEWLGDKENKNISIYPNPTNKTIILNLGDLTYGDKVANNYKIEIQDMYGRLVYSSVIKPEQVEVSIDLESYRHGLYFLNVTGTNFKTSHKFIKQ
jgi:bacillolysin